MKIAVWCVLIFMNFILFTGCTADYYAAKALTINDIDLGKIADGTYKGVYNGPFESKKMGGFTVTVEVIVASNKIVAININEAETSKRPLIAKKLVQKVIEKQSLKVDAQSGASISSKSILKAIEIALTAK